MGTKNVIIVVNVKNVFKEYNCIGKKEGMNIIMKAISNS